MTAANNNHNLLVDVTRSMIRHISAIGNQTINEDSSTAVITYQVNDIDNTASTLVVVKATSDADLIPLTGIILTGNGRERTVQVVPTAHQFGVATITLTVSDPDGLTSTSSFTVTVLSVNDQPTFVAGSNVAVNEDHGTYTSHGLQASQSVQPTRILNHNFCCKLYQCSSVFDRAEYRSKWNTDLCPSGRCHGVSSVTVYLNRWRRHCKWWC
jgi:hypothetical protein